jgi:PAS domain S-box-containing protein
MKPRSSSDEPPVSLESVIRTNELSRRPSRAPENYALLALARSLSDSPRSVLKTLIGTAASLCHGASAGICLLEARSGQRGFRCHEASGPWASLAGEFVPYDSSPCGAVLERDATQLFSRPHRHYGETAATKPSANEALYTPFRVRDGTVGTVWVVTHDECCAFDAEDARVLETLAHFASMAYQISASLDALEQQGEALRESEERFRLMADSSPFIIWVTDPESNIEFVNEAYRNYFGVTNEQVLDQGWRVLVHPDDAEGHASSYLAAMRAREPWTYEVRVRRFDGEWRWVESRALPRFSVSGEFLGAVGSAPDVTERKLHRDHLETLVAERTKELERSHHVQRRTETMAVIGALGGGIAHDLGNLLFPLHYHLESLQRLDLSDAGRNHVEALVSTTAYLLTLNERLQVYLKGASSGASVVHGASERVTLDRWCREVEGFFRTAVPEGVSFECAVPAGLPPVRANKAALTQAVYNLIQNGVQAIEELGPGGGSVELRCSAVDEAVRIVVEDDGPGIPPAAQERCLDLFFTSRSATGGTGLGLSLVRGFVKSVGGTVEFRSPVEGKGRGTAVVLSIPAAGGTPASGAAAGSVAASPSLRR